MAFTYQLSDRLTGLVQGPVSRSIFADATSSELSSLAYQITGGLRFGHGPVLVSIALTENVANLQNTPDIGVHLSACFILR